MKRGRPTNAEREKWAEKFATPPQPTEEAVFKPIPLFTYTQQNHSPTWLEFGNNLLDENDKSFIAFLPLGVVRNGVKILGGKYKIDGVAFRLIIGDLNKCHDELKQIEETATQADLKSIILENELIRPHQFNRHLREIKSYEVAGEELCYGDRLSPLFNRSVDSEHLFMLPLTPLDDWSYTTEQEAVTFIAELLANNLTMFAAERARKNTYFALKDVPAQEGTSWQNIITAEFQAERKSNSKFIREPESYHDLIDKALRNISARTVKQLVAHNHPCNIYSRSNLYAETKKQIIDSIISNIGYGAESEILIANRYSIAEFLQPKQLQTPSIHGR